jgi:hypothetical protein
MTKTTKMLERSSILHWILDTSLSIYIFANSTLGQKYVRLESHDFLQIPFPDENTNVMILQRIKDISAP